MLQAPAAWGNAFSLGRNLEPAVSMALTKDGWAELGLVGLSNLDRRQIEGMGRPLALPIIARRYIALLT